LEPVASPFRKSNKKAPAETGAEFWSKASRGLDVCELTSLSGFWPVTLVTPPVDYFAGQAFSK
jgi:hypothetical protein